MNLIRESPFKSKESRSFFLFLLVHFALWTLLPLLRQSIPMDSVEAIIWGQICDFGTQKHPPLSGFPAAFFFWLFGQKAIGIYLLSQVFILLGFVYIFRLARLFLSAEKSFLCVILLEGVIYYGFTSAEYNVNIVSLALWPMLTFYFYKATHEGTLSSWILFGAFTALNLLTKYTCGVLIMGAGLYMLASPLGRKAFKTLGLYLSIITALIIISPHIIWLYNYDFFVLDYFAHRTGKPSSLGYLSHLWHPVKFISAQVLAGLGALLLYFAAFYKNQKSPTPQVSKDDKLFILCLGLAPLLIFAAIALFTGVYLKSMWGTPLLYMLTIGLFVFFPFTLGKTTFKNLLKGAYALMFLFLSAAGAIYTCAGGEKQNLDAKAFAALLHSAIGGDQKLYYVAGDIWYAANMSLYDRDRPTVILDIKNPHNPWVREADFLTRGVLIISEGKGSYHTLKSEYETTPLSMLEIKMKSPFGKTEKRDIYYFMILPSKEP